MGATGCRSCRSDFFVEQDSQPLASPSFVGVRSLADISMKFASELNFAFGTHCIGIHAADITQNPPWLLESPMDLSKTEKW